MTSSLPRCERSSLQQLLVIAALLTSAATTTLLTACNTTAGVGKDMQSAGEGIEDAAERNK